MKIRFFAGAKAATGIEETTSEAMTARQLAQELGDKFGPHVAEIVARSVFLVDGARVSPDSDTELASVSAVDVLPPFAGG